jgi:nucleotide-binding universal stress UspA family protein
VDALLADAADRLAPLVASTVTINRVLASGPIVGAIRAQARAMHADLLVMAPAEQTLRRLVLGATVTRIVRQSRSPVLIVRADASAAYRRPVVAIDFDDAAREVLMFVRRVLAEPGSRVALLHVFDAPFEGLIYLSPSEDAIRTYREQCRQRAQRNLLDLLADIGVDHRRWSRWLELGEPRNVIPAVTSALRADLVVLGTHARSIVGHALLGSVTADVLGRVSCDVLVVPPARTRREAG